MDPIWKTLPIDLVYKICNFLPKVRQIDPRLKNEIVNQWHIFDQYKFNCISLFGLDNYEFVMYDDMRYGCNITDDFPEDMPFEVVIAEMWKRMNPDQRKYLKN